MKKIVLALTVAILGTIVVNAQQPRRHGGMNPEQVMEKRIERLDKVLNLTDQQKAEIMKIYSEEMKANPKDRAAKAEKGEKAEGQPKMDRHEMMKAKREATDAKIESVLTPEQAAKFAEMKKHEGKRGHEKGRQGAGKLAPRDGCEGDCSCKKDK